MPPASEAKIKIIWSFENLWRIRGCDAVDLRWLINLFKQFTSCTVAWLRRDDKMLTTPAHSGRVWCANQFTRYNIERNSSNSECSSGDCLSLLLPFESLTGKTFSMMYFCWCMRTRSDWKETERPAKSDWSKFHFPKVNLSFIAFCRIGRNLSLAATLMSSTSMRIWATISPCSLRTIQQGSKRDRTKPNDSKKETNVKCHLRGASSKPYTGAISLISDPEGKFRPWQGSTKMSPAGLSSFSDWQNAHFTSAKATFRLLLIDSWKIKSYRFWGWHWAVCFEGTIIWVDVAMYTPPWFKLPSSHSWSWLFPSHHPRSHNAVWKLESDFLGLFRSHNWDCLKVF